MKKKKIFSLDKILESVKDETILTEAAPGDFRTMVNTIKRILESPKNVERGIATLKFSSKQDRYYLIIDLNNIVETPRSRGFRKLASDVLNNLIDDRSAQSVWKYLNSRLYSDASGRDTPTSSYELQKVMKFDDVPDKNEIYPPGSGVDTNLVFAISLIETDAADNEKQLRVEREKLFNTFKSLFNNFAALALISGFITEFKEKLQNLKPEAFAPEPQEGAGITEGEAASVEAQEQETATNFRLELAKVNGLIDEVFRENEVPLKYNDLYGNGETASTLAELLTNLLKETLKAYGQPLNEEYLRFYDILEPDEIIPFDNMDFLSEGWIIDKLTQVYKTLKDQFRKAKIKAKDMLQRLLSPQSKQQIIARTQDQLAKIKDYFKDLAEENGGAGDEADFDYQTLLNNVVALEKVYNDRLGEEIKF